MGFKFGYVKFSVGIVEIEVQNIDTEEYKGKVNLCIPTAIGSVTIYLYSGINWSGNRSLSAKVGFEQNKPVSDPQDEDYESEGEDENESANN